MLFGGNSGSCGGCGCKSCQECTRTCTNPHTGTAFETVYTLYFEGAEAGSPSDGYLDATGDSDTSDPYDGMDGTGPWSQTVSGTFSLTKTTTRYPCYVTVSFWRSNFVLGSNTIPPPATTLTEERITVTNSVISEGAINAGGVLLEPGESHQFDMQIPVVAGAGDQSANDPRTYSGTIRVSAACANQYVDFTIDGQIAWNVQKRQHVLYGLVRECYEEPGICDTFCNGNQAPDVLYLTISNYTGIIGKREDGTSLDYNGTYVLDREPSFCAFYTGGWEFSCAIGSNPLGESLGTQRIKAWLDSAGYRLVTMYRTALFSGICRSQALQITSVTTGTYCGTGVIASGSNGKVYMDVIGSPTPTATLVSGSFDWEIST